MKRAVITGMGAVTPVGNNIEDFWESLMQGRHGFGKITKFDTDLHKVELGAEVKGFEYPDKKESKRMDLFTQYGMVATKEALEDSGLVSGENIDPYRCNIIVGSGIGGVTTFESEVIKGHEKGPRRVSALFIPKLIGNILPGYISINFGIKGSSFDIVTACASGTHAIGEALRQIRHGYADAVVAGAAEAPFVDTSIAGFENMQALSTNKDKDRCCIPFDKEREGFVMGEGAGILIVEELEHAKSRGARVYAEIVGYGSTTDAYHITSPAPDGEGAARAMEFAIKDAGIKQEDIDYINAHGTSTPYNDLFETMAIKRVFGDRAYDLAVSSTKSMTGHMLGAAGSVEAIVCAKAIENDTIPGTIGLKVADEELDLDYVPGKKREMNVDYTLSNSLGFGGHNATIILKKFKE